MSTMRRKELGKDEQKNLIMNQIAAATGGVTTGGGTTDGSVAGAEFKPLDPGIQDDINILKAQAQQHVAEELAKERGIAPGRPFVEDAVISTRPPGLVMVNDLVQVVNAKSPQYGMTFVLGALLEGKAHGFLILQGPKKEYVTTEEIDLHSYGESQVKSRNPVSPEWAEKLNAAHRQGGLR